MALMRQLAACDHPGHMCRRASACSGGLGSQFLRNHRQLLQLTKKSRRRRCCCTAEGAKQRALTSLSAMFRRSASAAATEPARADSRRLLCLLVGTAALAHLACSDMIAPESLLWLVLLVLAGVAAAALARKSRGKRFPPGPFPWPLVGNTKQLQQLSRELGGQHEALLELCRRYASPVVSLRLGGGQPCLVVSGAECINAVLGCDAYDGRPWNFFIALRNMGKKKGITMNDGEDWRRIRGWFVRSMRSVGLARRRMCRLLSDELELALRGLGQADGLVARMKPLVVPVIVNVLWTLAAGRRFDEARLQRFVGLMERRARAFDMTGGWLAAYPWIRHLAPDYSGYNLLTAVNREFRCILEETIDEHKRNYVAGSEADLIDMFLGEMYAGAGPEAGFDDDQLVAMLLDVLLAGLNITATTLDFLFLNMLVNQDAQRLLHEEIDRVIGPDRLPDIGDRAKMPYAEAVIVESQRLTPVVPVIGPRRVLRDCRLLDFHVPRDTFVLMNLHSINSDPELYPQPGSFKPERFVRDGQLLRDDNLLFFGKGRRQCPGISLAKTSLFLVFVGIMQRYRLLPVPGQQPPSLRVKAGMTMAPKAFDVFLVSRSQHHRAAAPTH